MCVAICMLINKNRAVTAIKLYFTRCVSRLRDELSAGYVHKKTLKEVMTLLTNAGCTACVA